MKSFTYLNYKVTVEVIEENELWKVFVDGSEFCNVMSYLGEYNAYNGYCERDAKSFRGAVKKLMDALM